MIYVLLLSGSLYADAAIFSELKKSLEEKPERFRWITD